MPRDEEEVRAALTAQADSNEEANALCDLASLSIQGNADQKRQRLDVDLAREPFELCPDFKSLPAVSARELPIDLRWRASRPKPEFPAPEIETERRCAQGERGVKKTVNSSSQAPEDNA